jgi:HD-GYP domain-containing protein (c-di-GMP phosphodiesterase class II)
MSDATRFLISLAQALAKMSLYSEGHPARGRAADASFEQLRILQQSDARPIFSFLGREVIYAQRALRELADWDWAERLSSAGVQRIEFQAAADGEEFRAFLEDILVRVALTFGARDKLAQGVTAQRATPIRFGAIGVRGAGVEQEAQDLEDFGESVALDLTEEADVVDWMHGEVGAERQLPLVEAEAVVRSLALAMHAHRRALIPLLTLKEFDQYTTTHALNVSVLAMGLAEQLGLSSREVRAYGVAGLLHDLGKVKVPVEVLRKPGALNSEELALMRTHPGEGAKLILASDRTLDLCAVVAFEHHIMIDGSGYPSRHTRRDCHHASKLVHVCDVFDALRTHRPYRVAWDTHAILGYIERRTGSEFEPEIANAFLSMMRQSELHLASARLIDEEPPIAV